jgi:hypothetical protein
MLSKSELKLLKSAGWEQVGEDPLEFAMFAQFTGGIHYIKGIDAVEDEIGRLKSYRDYKIKKVSQKEDMNADILKVKEKVKDFLEIGITEETLLQFYMVSCWFGRKRGEQITSSDLKKWFKEVFDEVDPP